MVTKDPARAHLNRFEDGRELVFIQILGNVGHVEIGVGLIRELLELRVEGFLEASQLMVAEETHLFLHEQS